MSAWVLAAYNLKGGVGKTAATVNLSYAASREHRRVLVWDLDPQGAATFYFRVKPGFKGGAKRLIGKKYEVADFIKETNYPGLDLMPADFSYRNLDLYLSRRKHSTERLARLLEPVRDQYDVIMLDCSPSISLISENIFRAVDTLVEPLIPTYLSVRAYEQIKRYCTKHPDIHVLHCPFFSMADRRKRLHCEMLNDFSRDHPELLSTVIGYSSLVEQMGARRAPLQSFAPTSPAARAFDDLWQEICKKQGEKALFSQNSNWK